MKSILISGVNKGLGKALVHRVLELNHNVIAIGRRENNFINEANVTYYQVDLSNEKSILNFAELLKELNPAIDGLINNAGLLKNIPFDKMTFSNYEEIYKVNVFGLAILTQKIIPYLNDNAHVVNISSMGGVQGSIKFPGLAAYSSSKGAVSILTELLAEEYKNSKIKFNALALGAVQTEMLESVFPEYKAPLTAKQMANYIVDFTLKGHQYFNGKILPVALNTP